MVFLRSGGAAPPVVYFFSLMFVACPVTFDLEDAEWFNDVDDARETALDWSVELQGENVNVYEAVETEDGSYEFHSLYSIFA